MIQIENLDFWYHKRRPLFQQLQLKLETGKIHGILGKNGTGKTTLLKLLIGGLFPREGSIKIDDQDVKQRHVSTLQNIFFLAEDYQVPSISITRYLQAYSSFYPRFHHDTFHQILDAFQIPFKSKLNALSLGQKKKFMIAFGIACQANYIIFDEPTNGLDIPSKRQFRQLLAAELTNEQTVIISTHQVRDLGKLLDTVVILDEGKIIFNQEIQQIEKQLLFTKSNAAINIADALYSEKILGGHIYVSPNTQQSITEAELEVLFNALSVNQKGILETFKA